MAVLADYTPGTIKFRDPVQSPATGASPWSFFPEIAVDSDIGTGFHISDDFTSISTGASGSGTWQIVKGTGASITLSSTIGGGWANIPTAASASDYQSLATQNAYWDVNSLQDCAFEVMLNVTEAATNASSWWCGFTSVITSGFLSSAGAPPASYSGAVFWKPTGALAVNFQTSNATVRNPSATTAIATAVSGKTLILGAYWSHNNGTTALVTPYVSTVVSNVRTPVVQGPTQNLVLASLANMFFGFGIQAGSGGTAETLTVDFARAGAGRYYV
jgi:hypothetical protein